MKIIRFQFIIVLAASIIAAAFAAGQDNMNTEFLFADLSWLVGHWEGDAFGGTCEEIWSPPSGGSMMCMFKLISGGEVGFYELVTITIDKGKPILKLKHFNADLTAWEEKEKVITFPYVNHSPGEIKFDGLTYSKISADSLRIAVSVKGSDGKINEEVINCRRMKK